jgi:AP-1-like transcription factor
MPPAPTSQPNFILTPQQQSLLYRALTSNQPTSSSPPTNLLTMSPGSMTQSPVQVSASGSIHESPFYDYDYSFGPDDTFDYEFGNESAGKMIGDLPDTGSDNSKDNARDTSNSSSPDADNADNADKRSHPDEDDEEREDGGGKRRESEGKIAKKPGRKPLTNEPSSVSSVAL